MRALTEALGHPERSLRCIHVAGTNGKGSTCAMLEAICRAQGWRTGLFTSPHLVRFNERIQINGVPVTDAVIWRGLSEIRRIIGSLDQPPTFFEITTALAFFIFSEQPVDVVILETGLGGRLDATNVVTPAVSALTSIELDHQRILGQTVGAIAREKAGIIKPGVPVVSVPQAAEVVPVLQAAASDNGADLHFAEHPVERWKLGLAGSHQRYNAALALLALEKAKIATSIDARKQGLEQVFWPGRFHQVTERVILDGAHNLAAVRQLVQTWKECQGGNNPTIIFGGLVDKPLNAMVDSLAEIASRFFLVPVSNRRGADPNGISHRPNAKKFASFDEAITAALARREPELVLVTGSLFLVGEALAYLDPRFGRYESSLQ